MDIPRPKKKNTKRYVVGGAVIAGLLFVTVAISRLEPAPPPVEGSAIWRDTVKQGTMVREVRGPGILEPERVRWVSAVTAGRVEEIYVEPGANVQASKVLLELTNPDV
ncbi:MAG: RND transporter, partial [Longimicrobiales bacterium]